jgi:hypothetical protein
LSAVSSASPAYVSTLDTQGKVQWSQVKDSTHSGTEVLDRFNDFSPWLKEDLLKVASDPFAEKQFWFVSLLTKMQLDPSSGHVNIRIDRANLLQMSHDAVMEVHSQDLHKYFRITFLGEPGLDAGGKMK